MPRGESTGQRRAPRSELRRRTQVIARNPVITVSREGREVVLGGRSDGGHLFDLNLVKEIKNWSSCEGGRRLGHVERHEHLKQLGWAGWERGLLGNS